MCVCGFMYNALQYVWCLQYLCVYCKYRDLCYISNCMSLDELCIWLPIITCTSHIFDYVLSVVLKSVKQFM